MQRGLPLKQATEFDFGFVARLFWLRNRNGFTRQKLEGSCYSSLANSASLPLKAQNPRASDDDGPETSDSETNLESAKHTTPKHVTFKAHLPQDLRTSGPL